jgi:hypothetical protein
MRARSAEIVTLRPTILSLQQCIIKEPKACSIMSSSPYAPAGHILNQIFKTRKGLKTIAYNKNGELTCSKTTYAQCSHVLQHKRLLDSLIKSVEVQAKNEGLLYILMYELLLGPNKNIRGGGALKRQLVSQKDELISTLKQL